MKIRKILLRKVCIPLKFQFSQANNPGSQQSNAAILEMHTQGGQIGYGESCPRTYVTGETIQSVGNDLKFLEPALYSTEILNIQQLQEQLSAWEKIGIGNCTLCILEMAWLDAWSKASGKTLPQLLDISLPESLNYSLIIPLIKPVHLIKLLQKISFFRPKTLKLKVNNDRLHILETIRLLREHFGNDIPIRFDVNGGWNLEEAQFLIPELLEKGIYSFEQVLPMAHTVGLQLLTKEFGREAKIVLDETLLSYQHAIFLLENKIGNCFNLKIAKIGGLFRTIEVYQLAKQYGIPCQLGAHFAETSLLAGAGVLLAGICKDLTAIEGALSDYLLEADLVTPKVQHDFYGDLNPINLFTSPGIAPFMNVDVLEKYTRENFVIL